MTTEAIFGVAMAASRSVHHGSTDRNARFVVPCQAGLGPSADNPPHKEGAIVAKNKNQNRQRGQQRQEQSNPAVEPHEHTDAMPQESGIASTTHVSRKQQKRFGHN